MASQSRRSTTDRLEPSSGNVASTLRAHSRSRAATAAATSAAAISAVRRPSWLSRRPEPATSPTATTSGPGRDDALTCAEPARVGLEAASPQQRQAFIRSILRECKERNLDRVMPEQHVTSVPSNAVMRPSKLCHAWSSSLRSRRNWARARYVPADATRSRGLTAARLQRPVRDIAPDQLACLCFEHRERSRGPDVQARNRPTVVDDLREGFAATAVRRGSAVHGRGELQGAAQVARR
jgi:hypothetical protein